MARSTCCVYFLEKRVRYETDSATTSVYQLLSRRGKTGGAVCREQLGTRALSGCATSLNRWCKSGLSSTPRRQACLPLRYSTVRSYLEGVREHEETRSSISE